jgi:hypothetical protein
MDENTRATRGHGSIRISFIVRTPDDPVGVELTGSGDDAEAAGLSAAMLVAQ